MSTYYERNKEKRQLYAKKYYERNKQLISDYNKLYYEKNRDHIIEYVIDESEEYKISIIKGKSKINEFNKTYFYDIGQITQIYTCNYGNYIVYSNYKIK